MLVRASLQIIIGRPFACGQLLYVVNVETPGGPGPKSKAVVLEFLMNNSALRIGIH